MQILNKHRLWPFYGLYGFFLGIVLACDARVELPPQLGDSATCPRFKPPTELGRISDGRLSELSGLVASRRQAGVLWVHNDSGAEPILYALDRNGALLAEVTIAGADAVDWEDIAIGPGPQAGLDYIYIADIGDNRRRRSQVTLYRLPEPTVETAQGRQPGQQGQQGQQGQKTTSATAETIVLHYEHRPANAEALFVDPLGGELYVITKKAGDAGLYWADEGVLHRLRTIDVGDGALVTGADISADGRMIALRTYNHGYLWRREVGETIEHSLARSPCAITVAKEPQGEAIAFDPASPQLLSISESREHGRGTVPIYGLPFEAEGHATDP